MTVASEHGPPAEPAGVRRTMALIRPAAWRLAGASALGAGAIGASIALMGTSAWLISRAAQHPSESALAVAIVGVQFFGLSRGFLRYAERLVGHDAALRVLADLRVRVYERLERLAPAGVPVFRRGDLLARVVDDVDSVQDVALRVVSPFAVALLAGAPTVVAVWLVLPSAGLILLVAMSTAAVVVPWLTWVLSRHEQSHQAPARGELAAAVVDLIEGAPELVVLGAMPGQLRRVEEADRRLRSIARGSARTAGIGTAMATLLAGSACWGGLVLGVRAVHDGRLNGVLLAVLALVPLAAFELVAPLPGATQALQRTRRAAGRVQRVTDAAEPVEEPDEPRPLVVGGAHTLRLRQAWARYPGAARPALRGVDIDLSPGRLVALVGPSGAGKSTVADVLVRFLELESGQATLDGVPLEQFAGDDVRKVVGLFGQSPHLFNTTLAENLRLARRSADDRALEEVLAGVGLGDWLGGLPDGLYSEVGHLGVRLSGGQRQRVALARVLLAEFPVLVLDEPAEHLDPASADALVRDLVAHRREQAVLLITHRLSGLEQADEIVVLDDGQVVERGTHLALLDADGHYARMRDEAVEAFK